MTMEVKRKFRAEGDQLVDTVNDLVFKAKLTQTELAEQVGKSDSQISLILNPLHCSQWTLSDLPVLMRLLDGKAIARVICGWLSMVPVDVPAGKVKAGPFFQEIAEWQLTVCKALQNGAISAREIPAIEKEMLDAICAWKELAASQGEGV